MNEGGADVKFSDDPERFQEEVESVLNIERVTYRVIQLGTFSKAEMADPTA
jgi:hypothetical protein